MKRACFGRKISDVYRMTYFSLDVFHETDLLFASSLICLWFLGFAGGSVDVFLQALIRNKFTWSRASMHYVHESLVLLARLFFPFPFAVLCGFSFVFFFFCFLKGTKQGPD